MAALDIVITNAGLAEIVNAERNGTAPVILSEVGFGTGQYEPDPSRTTLEAEFKRLTAIAGGSIGGNVIHLNAQDASDDEYTVHEVGIYTESGTLFAVFSQGLPILQKVSLAQALLAIDIVLTNVNPASVTVGDTNFQFNRATTEMQGVVQLATADEVALGLDDAKVITPATLAKAFSSGQIDEDFQKLGCGVQKLPGGGILQWGKALVAPDGSTRIVLPQAFPNACQYVNVLPLGSIQPAFSVNEMTPEAISFKHNGNGGVNAIWFAVGY